ncbi:peptidase C25 [Bacteroidia bacterium]|nr:peptidase C25 [Bacteroidia bacterium]
MKHFYLLLTFMLAMTPFQGVKAFNDGSRYAEKSRLASGKWIQLKVTDNAVYKLTYDEIKKSGISDPAKVKIYGYGGWILDEDFTKPYIDDLPEVSVYMNKGSDGVFNSGDYLLFYGRGTRKWTYDKIRDVYEHENNPYSTYGSYFLTESETGPQEMEVISPVSGLFSGIALRTFDDYAVHERDSLSITNSGRELFGESFVNKPANQLFTFNVPGITSDPGKVRLSFAAAPKSTTPVSLSIDGQQLLNLSLYPASDYYQKANLADRWGAWNGEKAEKVAVTVSYNSSGQSVAFLNLIALNMKRNLQFYNEAYTFFRDKESLRNPVKYFIQNANSNCQVWDVTDNFDTRAVQTELGGSELTFETRADGILHEYVLVDLTKSFPSPQVIAEPVNNQNLHGLEQTEMVILAPTVFLPQAKTLAEKHRSHSGLKVTVVDDKWVFNEFSSGTPDATAYRRFMKMFYDRAVSDSDKPKYLLLFGDGIFDNRHLTNIKIDPKYYLLTYQLKESVNEIYSYGTDDYFGFSDDNEGTSISSDELDLGIGRFPVSSIDQANNAVNKVIAYMDNKQLGNWKNKIIFTADNTDSNTPGPGFCEHAAQADDVAQYVENNYPEYMISKYYMDAYKPITVNGKVTFPEAKKSFLSSLKEGCFLLNYTGHGSTTAWSSEDMLNISDIRQMTYENLPLWITATCDFGWFDGTETSAGELAFLNKNSGAIALYTTTRVVYSANNFAINKQLVQNIFKKENGQHLRLGDILRYSKIALKGDSNKLNYVLLGDPALELNYPGLHVQLESVNGKPVQNTEDLVFKALDKVSISGNIVDESGNKVDDFSGSLKTNVFDSRRTIESISTNTDGGHFSYINYPNMIYMGNNEVKNGSFDVTFTVPLDISYTKDQGKMNFYASDSQTKRDASGSFRQYVLAGTGDNPDNEEGPEIIRIFLNTENFRDGDKVNETPFFFANVFDEDGINRTGSGLGHDIMISIDGNPAWTYILNNYYDPVDDREGNIGFSIPELPAGYHTLTFRIWDILNNPSVDSLHFNVVKAYKPAIFDLQARENPARLNTYFVLSHDLPETPLNVQIRVYDLTGRSVWTYSERGSSGYMKYYPVEWNLVNGAGNRVQPGVYIYRAIISTATGKEATKAKKIIVLGQ